MPPRPCHRHPDQPLTSLCSPCLRERLFILRQPRSVEPQTTFSDNASMWRRSLSLISYRTFCSSSSIENPSLYSFLQPSLFSIKPTSPPPNPPSTSDASPKQLSADAKASLETAIHRSLSTHDTDEAWKSFKSLTGVSSFPSKSLTNSLIAHLSSVGDVHNLKRAFVSVIFLIEKNPNSLEFETVKSVLRATCAANTPAPAFALVKSMLKNRFFVPFDV